MDIRYGVREVLHIRRALQDRIIPLDEGQQDIRCWLLDNRGVSGKERKRLLAETADDCSEDSYSILSDDSLAEFDWNANLVETVPRQWIPDVSDQDAENTRELLANAENGQQIVTTVNQIDIRAGSLRRLITDHEIDSIIVDSYLSQLGKRSTRRKVKIMGADFMRRLYNPAGIDPARQANTIDFSNLRTSDKNCDIYNYDVVLIPMLVKSHWTLVMVDVEKEQIRYLDKKIINNNNKTKS